MTAWRVISFRESFLFSGPIEHVSWVTIDELKMNPEVIWWRNEECEDPPFIFTPSAPYHIYTCAFQNNRHTLVDIEIEQKLFESLEEYELQIECMKFIRGEASKVQGPMYTMYYGTWRFPLLIDDLLDKSRDRRLPSPKQSLRSS